MNLNLFSRYKNYIKNGEFLRFVVSGAVSALVEYCILIVLKEYCQLPLLYSNAISYIVTNIFNYFLSRLWVFGKGTHHVGKEMVLFFIVALVGLGLNQLVMDKIVSLFHVDYKIVKVFAIGIVVIWNFFAKKLLVFKK